MSDFSSKLSLLLQAHQAFALATIIRVKGSSPREPGAKMLVLPGGERIIGTIGGGTFETLVIRDAIAAIVENKPHLQHYPLGVAAGQCCGGSVEVFIDVYNAGPTLYLMGAGHVGQALCQVLEGTPFAITLWDEREEWREHPALPATITRSALPWEEFVAQIPGDPQRSFVAVMTHSHKLDELAIASLLQKPLRYLGLIGSKTKWARFQDRLKRLGHSDEALSRVRCPIGLPIGGKSPKEVAISIAAELLADNSRHSA